MYQTRILNEKEVAEFNKKYNMQYQIIHIKQRRNRFYAILDLKKILPLKEKEVISYFI